MVKARIKGNINIKDTTINIISDIITSVRFLVDTLISCLLIGSEHDFRQL